MGVVPSQVPADDAKYPLGQVERQVVLNRTGVAPEHPTHVVALPEQLVHGLEQPSKVS